MVELDTVEKKLTEVRGWSELAIRWRNRTQMWFEDLEVGDTESGTDKGNKEAGLGEAFNFTGDGCELLVGCWGGNV